MLQQYLYMHRLCRLFVFFKSANRKATAEIFGKRINQGAGLGLEIPVIYKIYGGGKEIFGQTGRTYSWQRDCKEGLRRKR